MLKSAYLDQNCPFKGKTSWDIVNLVGEYIGLTQI